MYLLYLAAYFTSEAVYMCDGAAEAFNPRSQDT